VQSIATRLDDVSTLPTLDPNPSVRPTRVHAPVLAARTDVGKVRQRNEDQFVIAQLGRWVRVQATSVGEDREITRLQGSLLVVADGMGGHGGGDVASAVTLDAFVEHSLLEMPWLGCGTPEGDALLAADFERFANRCQTRLVEVARRKDLPPKLGTTLTAAYLTHERIIVMHVGDTRAYVVRGGLLRRLTTDHTLGTSHILTNAIGGNPDLPKPELCAVPLAPGDRVLLCSDGLHGTVDDATIHALLGGASTPQAAADALVEEALRAGGPDNITTVVGFA
jgi:PPM family protein phosphatase